MVGDKTNDELAIFIDNTASKIQVDYGKLDFPSLLGTVCLSRAYFNFKSVYLCQRRGTKQYIGTMFKVCSYSPLCTVTDAAQDHDLDESGEISQTELQSWMMKTGKNLTWQQSGRLLRSIDFDNNGNIGYREFLLVVVRKIIVANSVKHKI